MFNIKNVLFVVVVAMLASLSHAQEARRVNRTGVLNLFDQLVDSGVWDFGSCLNNDDGMPPVTGSPYISANRGELVKLDGLLFKQEIIHYQNNECESGKGYTVIRQSAGVRSCAVATYNHFCKGAPRNTVLKTGVWDFGNCAGGDRHLCPGLGLSAKNGENVTYRQPRCASGYTKCTVDSPGFGKHSCEIARYIHTCEQ